LNDRHLKDPPPRHASCCGDGEPVPDPRSGGEAAGQWTARFTEQGTLALPVEAAKRSGFLAGSEIQIEEQAGGLLLRRPLTRLAKVYVEATNRCNLECRTCVRLAWEAPPGSMLSETAERLFASLAEISPPPEIIWGGLGEPLLHPGVVEWVSRSKQLGSRVSLITNGTLLTESIAHGLLDAGLDMLWVSLDGVSEETFSAIRPGATLEQVIANVEAFQAARRSHARHGAALGLVFVIMRCNQAELPALLRLGDRLGARHILVSNVLPHTAEMQSEVLCGHGLSRGSAPGEAAARTLTLPRLDWDRLSSPVLNAISHSGWNLTNEAGASSRGSCPFIESGAIVIGWDGRVSPCLPLLYPHVRHEHGHTRMSHPYTAGHIGQATLNNLWLDPEYLAFRQKVRSFDFAPCHVCSECDLSASNETDCFGSGFPTCAGCPWARGVILCP